MMHDELIRKVTDLMNEQTAAYTRLKSATNLLSASLVRGEPESIESLTRAGESELLRMRSRLLEITSALTNFAELRAQENVKSTLELSLREQFDTAAKELLTASRDYQKIAKRAGSLARGGSSFTTACIQQCGVSPSTYRAPVLKYAEGAGR
jgi:hypothetical protein